jgi:hypothetical protein
MKHRLIPYWLLVAFATGSHAQTTQKVIDQYLRAHGGAKALEQIRTAVIAGSATEESTGRTGSYSLILKAPDRFYSELIIGPDRAVEAFNGMSAWRQEPGEGARTLTGPAAAETEALGRYWNGRLTDLKKSKLGVQLRASEKVRGRDADHLEVSIGPGVSRHVFFDLQTHFISRETSGGPTSGKTQPIEQYDYDDYRPVQGIQVPFHMELRRGDRQYKVSVTRAEFNSPVEDSVFSFPREMGVPLPDIATLILDVTRNQKAVEEIQKQYTCHVTTEEDKTDSKGQITSSAKKEFEVFNIAGEEVRHLVAKEGQLLAGKEKQQEEERFNKEFARLTRKEADSSHDPQKQAKQQAKEEARISDFLRAVRFSNARRERFRGEDVIAVDFGPNPEHKPENMIENVIHQLAGVIWIDDHAHDVVRLEAHFTGSAKVGGGVLGSVGKGSSFVFEQARVNNEVWLPTYDEVHLTGRILLFKLRANQVDRYTECKKFHAESTIIGVQE